MRVAFFMRQADSDWLAGKRGVVSSYDSANLFLLCTEKWGGRGGNVFVDEVEDVPEIRSQWPTGGSRSFYGRTTLSRRCAGDRICNRTSSCPGYCARVTNTHTRVTTHTRTHTHTPGQPKGPEREAQVNQNSIIITNLFCSLMLLIFH